MCVCTLGLVEDRKESCDSKRSKDILIVEGYNSLDTLLPATKDNAMCSVCNKVVPHSSNISNLFKPPAVRQNTLQESFMKGKKYPGTGDN